MHGILDARARAAQGWFGYGNWVAPYWFVGMEPGGKDELPWYEAWVRLGGHELCDCRQHHLLNNFEKFHHPERPRLQSTWIPLIQLLLSFLERPSTRQAASVYQRDHWGSDRGQTALLDISALREANLKQDVEREAFRTERLNLIRKRLSEHRPQMAIFYGLSYRATYETIMGSSFGTKGYCWASDTLCVLLRHPAARPPQPESWWINKGQEIRLQILAKRTNSLPNLASTALVHHPVASPYSCSTDVIRLLVQTNPKLLTSKSWRRFDCYQDGMTVGDYEEAIQRQPSRRRWRISSLFAYRRAGAVFFEINRRLFLTRPPKEESLCVSCQKPPPSAGRSQTQAWSRRK